jgi:mxaL protein
MTTLAPTSAIAGRRARAPGLASRLAAGRGRLDMSLAAVLAALALLLVALAMPAVKIERDAFDHIVVFDLTQSMNVEDHEIDGRPVNRLDFAREAARRALRGLPCGSRVGWGAFAEYRSLLLLAPIEVCESYNDLLLSLDQIDGRMRWANASEVAKGLFWAVRAAKEIGATGGEAANPPNLIFISDGHESPPLGANARPAFDDVKPGEVHGWVVGVGGFAPRPIPRVDAEGRPLGFFRAEDVIQQDSVNPAPGGGREHLSGLREPHLKALASQVGFDYLRLEDIAGLLRAMRDPRLAQQRPVATDLYWLPASLALLLLVWRFAPRWRLPPLRPPAVARGSAPALRAAA